MQLKNNCQENKISLTFSFCILEIQTKLSNGYITPLSTIRPAVTQEGHWSRSLYENCPISELSGEQRQRRDSSRSPGRLDRCSTGRQPLPSLHVHVHVRVHVHVHVHVRVRVHVHVCI